ncbi:hypothetical protein NL676_029718 [Syzygium grande]|nr:hypothetical protein NL676_029718 [Syzygium grande]
MPPARHLEQLRLNWAHPSLINNIVGLNKLKSLRIWGMESLECVPEECWKSLASLEKLDISFCPGLTSLSKATAAPPPPLGRRHQSNQVDLDSSDSEELDLSNYHETSGGNNLILELHGSPLRVSLWTSKTSISPPVASPGQQSRASLYPFL